MFKHIIISLFIGEEVILLDSDFTDSELINLTGHSNTKNSHNTLDKFGFYIQSKNELIKKLRNTSDNWSITLFTSGTTGIPKKVTHNFNSITRFVKISKGNRDNIWGFAYNPTHMAGITSFFPSFVKWKFNSQTFWISSKKFIKKLKNNITHISATPTFYKLLLPCEKTFHTVNKNYFWG